MSDLRGRALWVVLGCLVCQLGLGYSYVYGPLLLDITEALDLTRAQFSSARAPLLLVIALGSPLAGAAAVRFGARPVLLLATVLLAATFVLLSRMQSLAELYVANVMLGLLMVGFGDIVIGAVVASWVARGRGLALGIVYTGSNLGGMILAPTVARLAEASDWRQALLVLGLGGALVILPFAAFVVRERREPPRPAGDPGPAASPTAEGLALHAAEGLDLRAALRTRSFWVLAVSLFAFFVYFLGIVEHLVAALVEQGLSRGDAADWFGVAIGMGLVSKVAMGLVADRLTPRTALLANQALLAVSAGILLLVPAPGSIPAFVATYGFAAAARDVVFPLAVAHCFGVRHMAQIYGTLMLVLAPAGTLGALIPAWIHDRTGSYDTAFGGYAVAMALVLGSLFWIRREHGRDAQGVSG